MTRADGLEVDWEATTYRWVKIAEDWEALYRQSSATCRRWETTHKIMCLNVVLWFGMGLLLGGVFR